VEASITALSLTLEAGSWKRLPIVPYGGHLRDWEVHPEALEAHPDTKEA
jgi:hypothetical protein